MSTQRFTVEVEVASEVEGVWVARVPAVRDVEGVGATADAAIGDLFIDLGRHVLGGLLDAYADAAPKGDPPPNVITFRPR